MLTLNLVFEDRNTNGELTDYERFETAMNWGRSMGSPGRPRGGFHFGPKA
jgi:hypothetical protein